jgi:hypothetical protein
MAYKLHTSVNTAVIGGGLTLFFIGIILQGSFAVGWIGLSLALLRFFYLGTQVRTLMNGVWVQFANANGWPINGELDPITLTPLSLLFGHDQSYSPVIDAELGEAGADLFVYQTATGSGRSQHTYAFTIARVRMTAAMPHILLRAKGNIWSSIRPEFEDHEALSLEGDFNDYFSLQIEKGQEINVLEILTPDVMQTLINYSQKEDIEILGRYLFFIMSGDSRTPESTKKLVESTATLSGRIAEQVAQIFPPQEATAQVTFEVPETTVTTASTTV